MLGSELQKLDSSIFCPSNKTVRIDQMQAVSDCIEYHAPDIVINAAALIDSNMVEKDREEAIRSNIIGAANVAQVCARVTRTDFPIRLAYISTDYVYKGDRGNYREGDELLPVNLYAWTKLGGECATRCVENHLIIRTSFGADKFPYPKAYADRYTSKDYVEVIAPMILKAVKSNARGVLNIGTGRKSFYNYAEQRNPAVGREFVGYGDHSLNTDRYEAL